MSRPRVWPVFAGWLLALVASAVAGGVVLLLLEGLGRHLGKSPGDLRFLLAGSVAAELALIGTALLLARPFTRERLGLTRGRATPAAYVVTVLGTLALAQTLDSIATLTGPHHSLALESIASAVHGARGARLVAAVLVIGGMAGAAEELFFRGFMLTRLAERWRPWVSVLVTGVLFGLMHLDPVQSILAFGLGLWLGHCALRGKSVLPAALAHATNNALYTLFAARELSSESVKLNAIVGGVCLLMFVGCVLALGRLLPPLPLPPPPPQPPPPVPASAPAPG
jgi:membrane protease YdiL (CAAX protease family)